MSRHSNAHMRAQRSVDTLDLLLQQAERYRSNFANAPPAIRDWRQLAELKRTISSAQDELLHILEYLEQ